MSDSDTGGDYSAHDLKRMDEQTARETLTVAQYERWEDVQALYDQVADTEQQWEQEAATVADVTVSADMDDLGTRVELYGNDLLVHADIEAPEFRAAMERLDEEFGDVTVENPDADGAAAFGDVDDDRLEAMADHLLEMLDIVLVRWDGTAWDALTDDQQQTILQQARSGWGIAGLLKAWGEIAVAIREDYEEMEATMQSFRGEERRGHR